MPYLKGQPFKPQFTDAVTGELMSGGSIEFYLFDTTTPTPYYLDLAGTAGGVSIALNASGQPENDIFFDSAVTYKLVIKDSSGLVLDTIKPYNVAASSETVSAIETKFDDELSQVDNEIQSIKVTLDSIPDSVETEGTAASLVTAHNDSSDAHPALTAAIDAKVVEAEAAASAAASAGYVYTTVTAGEAARTNGQYFWVVSAQNNEVLELWLMGASTATDTGKRTASSALQDETDAILLLFDLVSSSNIYNPNSNGYVNDSVVSAAGSSVSALAKYMVSGFTAVTPGQTVMIDITSLGEEWEIYEESIQTYNAEVVSGAARVALLSPTVLTSRRLCYVTIPAGADYLLFNIRKLTGTTPDAAEFAQARSLTMLYVGTTQLAYQAYTGALAYTPKAEFFALPSGAGSTESKIKVQVVASSIYVKQKYNSTHDTVRHYIFNDTSLYPAGVVDFRGVGTVLKGDQRSLDLAFGSSDKLYVGNDNAPPIRFNNAYLGGGHGIPATKTLTKTAHGLTNIDVGDVGTDGAAKSWVLSKIVDADNIMVTAQNTGTATDWIISGSISGSTITFAAAGAFAFTSQSPGEYKPLAQNYNVEFVVDGATVTNLNSVTACDSFEIRETYGIPNAASFLTALVNEKGTATPKEPSSALIQTQIKVDLTWRFDKYGSCVMYYSNYNEQDYARGSADYFGGLQRQGLVKSGRNLLQYIPDVSPVSGLDFKNKADITSNAASINIPVSSCDDVNNPASHFSQIIANGSTPEYGCLIGYNREIGVGVPATRASVVTNVLNISTSEKQYPRAVDSAVQPVGGEFRTAVAYDAYYDMSSNTSYTVNNFVEFADGSVHWVFDCHTTLNNVWVETPSDLIGRSIQVLDKSASLTVHNSDVVMGSGILISVSGGYGRCVVKII